jgi:hypothetical protein
MKREVMEKEIEGMEKEVEGMRKEWGLKFDTLKSEKDQAEKKALKLK